MAEDNMGVENSPRTSMPEIQYESTSHFSGEDFERMRTTEVPGGGTQLEHFGDKSNYPRNNPPLDISYIKSEDYTQEDFDRMRTTTVVGGGTQLEHLGESSPIPPNPTTFRNRLVTFLRLKQSKGHSIEGANIKAVNMKNRYNEATIQGRKDIQSQIVRHLDQQTAELTRPIPVKIKR